MGKTSNVYCLNCKYMLDQYKDFYPGSGYTPLTRYICTKLTVYKKDPIGNIYHNRKDEVDCYKQNQDNNCEHYEKKWWKFWIR